VGVNFVVVSDPSWQLTHYGFGIWSRTERTYLRLIVRIPVVSRNFQCTGRPAMSSRSKSDTMKE